MQLTRKDILGLPLKTIFSWWVIYPKPCKKVLLDTHGLGIYLSMDHVHNWQGQNI